jgi:hypothetical protein
MAESTGNDQAVGDHGCSIGLWQVNRCAHPQYSEGYLKDPQNNAVAAHEVYTSAGSSFSPWTMYKNGIYLMYMPTAEVAAQRVQPKGGILAGPAQAGTHLPDVSGGPSIVDAAKAIGAGVSLAAKAGTWLSDPHNLLRIVYVVVGVSLVTGALVMLAAPTVLGLATPVGKAAKTVGKVTG